MDAVRQDRLDVARLTLETLVNTYTDSPFASKAEVALQDPRIANCAGSWTIPLGVLEQIRNDGAKLKREHSGPGRSAAGINFAQNRRPATLGATSPYCWIDVNKPLLRRSVHRDSRRRKRASCFRDQVSVCVE